MKVVDMFGCGVPVCSANYSCVEELVHNGRNGMLFNDAEELASQLKALFHNFPEENSRLKKLKAGALASSERKWTDEWGKVGMDVFTQQQRKKNK
jgi:beta-1,4-mannosyltransferase